MVPIANVEAERRVIGSVLSAASYDAALGWRIYRRAQRTKLVAEEFWSPTLGELYRLLGQLTDRGVALDSLSVAQVIDSGASVKIGKLKGIVDDGLWQERAHSKLALIAAEATAFSNIEHFCLAVRKAASDRRKQEAGRA